MNYSEFQLIFFPKSSLYMRGLEDFSEKSQVRQFFRFLIQNNVKLLWREYVAPQGPGQTPNSGTAAVPRISGNLSKKNMTVATLFKFSLESKLGEKTTSGLLRRTDFDGFLFS